MKAKSPVTVWFRGGVDYLPETMVFTADDSGSKSNPVTYASYVGEEAVLSGGAKLSLTWQTYRVGIVMARVPEGLKTDQLFINGQLQKLARYPNYDDVSQYFQGSSPDAFSKERAARWAGPEGRLHSRTDRSMWGDFHYVIMGRTRPAKSRTKSGGRIIAAWV